MSQPDPWVVHKFGGSSVADADCFRKVAAILESAPAARLAVVLSACKGVTDALLRLVALAERQDGAYRGELAQLRARHAAIAQEVLTPPGRPGVPRGLRPRLPGPARDPARGGADPLGRQHRERPHRRLRRDLVLAAVPALLRGARAAARGRCSGSMRAAWCVVDWGPLGPGIQWTESRAQPRRAGARRTSAARSSSPASSPPTAAACRPRSGATAATSPPRSSARCWMPTEIHIWTDVDGVLSADPRRVPDAHGHRLALLQRGDGAGVLRRQGDPSADHGAGGRRTVSRSGSATPSRPQKAGTLICAQPDSALPVKGITSIERVALVNLEGTGMIGVPGTAHRLFGALREEGISVILISQGSSEHSICCAIPAGAGRARRGRACGAPSSASSRTGRSRASTSIRTWRSSPWSATAWPARRGSRPRCSAALGAAGVNVRAIAQGASERNISAVVEGRNATRALRAVHAGLYLSPHTLSIGVIGPGTVGRVLLDQLASQSERLRQQFKLDLRVRGIMSSKRMLLADPGIALADWRDAVPGARRAGRPRAASRARARRLPAAHGAHRLHGERGGGRALRRLARRRASTS